MTEKMDIPTLILWVLIILAVFFLFGSVSCTFACTAAQPQRDVFALSEPCKSSKSSHCTMSNDDDGACISDRCYPATAFAPEATTAELNHHQCGVGDVPLITSAHPKPCTLLGNYAGVCNPLNMTCVPLQPPIWLHLLEARSIRGPDFSNAISSV